MVHVKILKIANESIWGDWLSWDRAFEANSATFLLYPLILNINREVQESEVHQDPLDHR